MENENNTKSNFDYAGYREKIRNLFTGKKDNGYDLAGVKKYAYDNPVLERYYKNIDKQQANLSKGKKVDTSDLMSKRYFFKDNGVGNQSYAIKGHGKDTVGFEGLFTQRQMEKAGENIYADDVESASIASTAISRVRYNPKTQNLYITFVGGDKEYLFPRVPSEKVRELLGAASKGRNYQAAIKPYAVSKSEAMAIKAKSKNK